MKIEAMYSHLNGYEWLLVHEKSIWEQIENIIETIDVNEIRMKISEEKTTRGKRVFSPIDINIEFKKRFHIAEWKASQTSCWIMEDYTHQEEIPPPLEKEQKIQIEAAGKRAIRSYNQTDFVKKRVAVEVQFGKYSFIAYDLFVKHLAFYIGNAIDVGVEILPMKIMQEEMSSGIGYYESALYDVARQGRGIPAVPLVLLGLLP